MHHQGRMGTTLIVVALLASTCSIDFGGGGNQPDEAFGEALVTLPEESTVDLAVGSRDDGIAISPLLFGTNVPAWIGPDRVLSDRFATALDVSGVSLMRFPGGSWSNTYAWSECMDRLEGCHWPWALAPQHIAGIIQDSGIAAIWTASINVTAEENAALVAFFNGSIDDTRPIGVDVDGVDWQTVGHWANRRAEFGFTEPVPILLWEIGNEIYGGVADSGTDCESWGWEHVWTCDGTEYLHGVDGYDGYLAHAAAMRAVDPTIEIGAVGVGNPGSWSSFGDEVISGAGDELDFYIVHWYGFGQQPDVDEVLGRPFGVFTNMAQQIESAATDAGYTDLPVALTEYNMVAWQDADWERLMPSVHNLFFMTATIGEMAEGGIEIATQWNIMNGAAANGTDYGMVGVDNGVARPQLFAMRLWARMGDTLLPLSGHPDLTTYAAIDEAGVTSVLLLNPSEVPVSLTIEVPGGNAHVTADEVTGESLWDWRVALNGKHIETVFDIDAVPPIDLGAASETFDYEVPPLTVTQLRFTPTDS